MIKTCPNFLPGDLVINVGGWDERVCPEGIKKSTVRWKNEVGVDLCFSSRGLRSHTPVPDGLARALESRPNLVSLGSPFLECLPEPSYEKILEILEEFNAVAIARDVNNEVLLGKVCRALPFAYCVGDMTGEATDKPIERVANEAFHRLVPAERLKAQEKWGRTVHD